METEIYFVVQSGRPRYYFRINLDGRIIDMPMKDEDAQSEEVQAAYGEIPEYSFDPKNQVLEETPVKEKKSAKEKKEE
jgi:hypothetical protein